jgi:hypothetical protein
MKTCPRCNSTRLQDKVFGEITAQDFSLTKDGKYTAIGDKKIITRRSRLVVCLDCDFAMEYNAFKQAYFIKDTNE